MGKEKEKTYEEILSERVKKLGEDLDQVKANLNFVAGALEEAKHLLEAYKKEAK